MRTVGQLEGKNDDYSSVGRKDGAQGRNRTTDTAIFSRMLYQLSYLGIVTRTLGGRL